MADHDAIGERDAAPLKLVLPPVEDEPALEAVLVPEPLAEPPEVLEPETE